MHTDVRERQTDDARSVGAGTLSDYEREAVSALIRDITFAGGFPEGAKVRGAFWRGWAQTDSLFVVLADGSEWIYKRSGERRAWMS